MVGGGLRKVLRVQLASPLRLHVLPLVAHDVRYDGRDEEEEVERLAPVRHPAGSHHVSLRLKVLVVRLVVAGNVQGSGASGQECERHKKQAIGHPAGKGAAVSGVVDNDRHLKALQGGEEEERKRGGGRPLQSVHEEGEAAKEEGEPVL